MRQELPSYYDEDFDFRGDANIDIVFNSLPDRHAASVSEQRGDCLAAGASRHQWFFDCKADRNHCPQAEQCERKTSQREEMLPADAVHRAVTE
mmetsp:Transcript_682/g.1547  ORF Transcript_682/g.1547 Transcript_682/m.1547 type:complete len:93 (+) Transcript_682:283-561(+)